MNWTLIPPAVDNDPELTDSEKRLLGKIIGLIDAEGNCWKGNTYLAVGTNWTVAKTRFYVTRLVEKGYLERDVKKSAELKTTRRLTPTVKCLRLLNSSQSSAKNLAINNTHINAGGFPIATASLGNNEQTLEKEKHNLSTAIVYPWDEIADYFDPVHNGKRSSMTAEQGRSKEGLYPCTYEEVWEVAKELRLSIEEVTTTHQTLLESINEGNKYRVISVFATLRRWLKKDLESGRLQPMDDVQMISIDGRYKPENVFKRAFRYAK